MWPRVMGSPQMNLARPLFHLCLLSHFTSLIFCLLLREQEVSYLTCPFLRSTTDHVPNKNKKGDQLSLLKQKCIFSVSIFLRFKPVPPCCMLVYGPGKKSNFLNTIPHPKPQHKAASFVLYSDLRTVLSESFGALCLDPSVHTERRPVLSPPYPQGRPRVASPLTPRHVVQALCVHPSPGGLTCRSLPSPSMAPLPLTPPPFAHRLPPGSPKTPIALIFSKLAATVLKHYVIAWQSEFG